VDKSLIKRVRALAAKQSSSVSAILVQELRRIADREDGYQQAEQRALARLRSPFPLGGEKMGNRESLHDRQALR
jgi:hypothetical protein